MLSRMIMKDSQLNYSAKLAQNIVNQKFLKVKRAEKNGFEIFERVTKSSGFLFDLG